MSEMRPEVGPGRGRLKDAVRQARIEMAERSGVVVDLHDAELARLEILNEALDPIYAEMPEMIDMFDRGITRGDPARLWIDMIAHVVMGRDKRVYRFVQDTRYGRRVIAESAEVGTIVDAVTKYIARRLVERERVLAGDTELTARDILIDTASRRRRRRRIIAAFVIGLLAGAGGLVLLAWLSAPG